jgi:hypothetical protein
VGWCWALLLSGFTDLIQGWRDQTIDIETKRVLYPIAPPVVLDNLKSLHVE